MKTGGFFGGSILDRRDSGDHFYISSSAKAPSNCTVVVVAATILARFDTKYDITVIVKVQIGFHFLHS